MDEQSDVDEDHKEINNRYKAGQLEIGQCLFTPRPGYDQETTEHIDENYKDRDFLVEIEKYVLVSIGRIIEAHCINY